MNLRKRWALPHVFSSGGWIAAEVEMFKRAGFLPFHMGDKILRTETAVVALLSQASLVQDSMPWILSGVASGATAKRAKIENTSVNNNNNAVQWP